MKNTKGIDPRALADVVDLRAAILRKVDDMRCPRCEIPMTPEDNVLWCPYRGCEKTDKRGPSKWEFERFKMEEYDRLARTKVGERE